MVGEMLKMADKGGRGGLTKGDSTNKKVLQRDNKYFFFSSLFKLIRKYLYDEFIIFSWYIFGQSGRGGKMNCLVLHPLHSHQCFIQ